MLLRSLLSCAGGGFVGVVVWLTPGLTTIKGIGFQPLPLTPLLVIRAVNWCLLGGRVVAWWSWRKSMLEVTAGSVQVMCKLVLWTTK